MPAAIHSSANPGQSARDFSGSLRSRASQRESMNSRRGSQTSVHVILPDMLPLNIIVLPLEAKSSISEDNSIRMLSKCGVVNQKDSFCEDELLL